MIDFFRDMGRPADEKRQEALSAYLDGTLSPREQQKLETQLKQDAALRAELAQLQMLKQQMRAMPRRRVPRSFSLDPALYGRPKSQPLQQLYPVLRGATALTALLFVLLLGLSLLNLNLGGQDGAPAEAITMAEPMADEALEPAVSGGLEMQAVPEAAESGLAAEEVPEPSAQPEAESALLEEPATESMEAAEESTDGDRPTADITAREGFDEAPQPLATVNAFSSEEAAPAEAAVAAAIADEAGTETAPVRTPLLFIAIGLGIAALVLLILTLIVGRRIAS